MGRLEQDLQLERSLGLWAAQDCGASREKELL